MEETDKPAGNRSAANDDGVPKRFASLAWIRWLLLAIFVAFLAYFLFREPSTEQLVEVAGESESILFAPAWAQTIILMSPDAYVSQMNPLAGSSIFNSLREVGLDPETDLTGLVFASKRGPEALLDDFVLYAEGHFPDAERLLKAFATFDTQTGQLPRHVERRKVEGIDTVLDHRGGIMVAIPRADVMVIASRNRMKEALDAVFGRLETRFADERANLQHLAELQDSRSLRMVIQAGESQAFWQDLRQRAVPSYQPLLDVLAGLETLTIGVKLDEESTFRLHFWTAEGADTDQLAITLTEELNALAPTYPALNALWQASKIRINGRLIEVSATVPRARWETILENLLPDAASQFSD